MEEKRPYPQYIRRSSEKTLRGGRRKLPPPTNARLKMGLPNIEVYYDFLDREKRMTNLYRKTFSGKTERIIVFCRIMLNWSRVTMHRKLGIPQSQIVKCYEKLRDLA